MFQLGPLLHEENVRDPVMNLEIGHRILINTIRIFIKKFFYITFLDAVVTS